MRVRAITRHCCPLACFCLHRLRRHAPKSGRRGLCGARSQTRGCYSCWLLPAGSRRGHGRVAGRSAFRRLPATMRAFFIAAQRGDSTLLGLPRRIFDRCGDSDSAAPQLLQGRAPAFPPPSRCFFLPVLPFFVWRLFFVAPFQFSRVLSATCLRIHRCGRPSPEKNPAS